MTTWLALASLWAAYSFFAHRRLRTFLHFYQQDEYDVGRFVRWLFDKRAYDIKASLAVAAAGVLALTSVVPDAVPPVLAAVALTVVAALEDDPTKVGKKPLNMTARARRICSAALAVMMAFAAVLVMVRTPLLVWIPLLQVTPFGLCAATFLWSGFEKRNNRRFVVEAQEKLAELRPTLIGVTGSFGKTSVKHILGHVLATQQPTLITPGSVNTELGISRIVRERLTARERFFVCEMGAYGPGSIARLCRLAPPDLGVITAIGYAHYERFQKLDTVAAAKFELAEAAVARGGRIVVAEAVLAFDAARAFVERHRAQVLLVGPGEAADVRVSVVRQTSTGISVDVTWRNERRTLSAPLHGAHHGLNLALAFGAAVALGIAPEDIALAMASTPQIQHRSEVKIHASGAILIDDAYNSNPSGFIGALGLLDLLCKEGGRRVLVTPGMAELGAAHDSEHAKIGEIAAHHVDVFLPIIPERLEAMISAYRAGNASGQIFPYATYDAANTWMARNLTAADVVLLENDLPDLYERRLRL